MNALLPLACPGCTTYPPLLFVLAMVAGITFVVYMSLRPYTYNAMTWGLPRVNAGRIGSLLIMLACLAPLFFIGRQEHSSMRVISCLIGLALCCLYLWLRSCWLLDVHQVTGLGKELVFPGLLAPAMLVLGIMVGSWGLDMFWVAPMWPQIVVSHTLTYATIGVPLALLVIRGLRYAFQNPEMTVERTVGVGAVEKGAE